MQILAACVIEQCVNIAMIFKFTSTISYLGQPLHLSPRLARLSVSGMLFEMNPHT